MTYDQSNVAKCRPVISLLAVSRSDLNNEQRELIDLEYKTDKSRSSFD